jgi:hypothetical protein
MMRSSCPYRGNRKAQKKKKFLGIEKLGRNLRFGFLGSVNHKKALNFLRLSA